jgi:hypothetical protein
MMQPRVENFVGGAVVSTGSVNTKPSLATLRSMSSNICCAIVGRSDCVAETCTVPYFNSEVSVVGLFLTAVMPAML